jgi:hypothetical protein
MLGVTAFESARRRSPRNSLAILPDSSPRLVNGLESHPCAILGCKSLEITSLRKNRVGRSARPILELAGDEGRFQFVRCEPVFRWGKIEPAFLRG